MQKRYPDTIDFNKEISAIMNRFKCITIEQMQEFFPENPAQLKEYALKSVYFQAQNNRSIIIKNKEFLINGATKEYRQDTIDCVWVLLDEYKKLNKEFGATLCHRACQPAEIPHTLSFFDGSKINKMVHVANKNEISKIIFAQDSFYSRHEGKHGKEKESLTRNIIIIRDEALLDEIAELDLTMPHKIVLLEGELNKKPTISYFEEQ